MRSSSWSLRGRGALLATTAAAAYAVGGCNEGPSFEPGVPGVEVLAGDEQMGRVQSLLADPLEVRIMDERGRPVPHHPVAWEALDGGVAVDADSLSDARGIARARWHVGPRAGPQGLRVVAEALGEHEFRATALPAPTTWIDVDVEPDGGTPLGRHPILIRSFDAYGNETSEDPVHGWVSSDSAVAFVEGGRLVIGAEGTARLESVGDLHVQHNVSVHVRGDGALLLNGWGWRVGAARSGAGAEGRPGRIAVRGSGSAPLPCYEVRQGFRGTVDEEISVQAIAIRVRSCTGAQVVVDLGFGGVLFPVEPGTYGVHLAFGVDPAHERAGEEPLDLDPAWSFEVTVPD